MTQCRYIGILVACTASAGVQGIALLGAGRRYDLGAVHMGMVFLIGPGYNGLPDAHTVGIIGICHGDIIEPTVYIFPIKPGKLSAVLPGVGPGAVCQRVTNLVIGNPGSVIGGQKIAPRGVSITVQDGICRSSQSDGSRIGILFPVYDVACGIIGPGPGFSKLLVVLPNQLVAMITIL